jgi:hypothetical protein
MKIHKRLSMLSALTLMLSVVLPAWAGTQLWDFEDVKQGDDWEAFNGTWKIEDGVYKETSAAGPGMKALVGEPDWDDYTIEADIRIDSNKWAGLVFRAQNEFEYYIFYPEPTPGVTAFFRHLPGGFGNRDRPPPNKTAIKGLDIKVGEWYTMKIEVKGNKFKCFLNDVEQFEGTDPENKYKTGRVGIWAWETKASFDNFTVSGPKVKDTLAVDPRKKLAVTWGRIRRDY